MRVVAILLFAVVLLFSCGAETETVVLGIGDAEITVEVARSEEDRARGLMNRKNLDEDAGMLFVYPVDTRMSFWMKETYVPLSIAFIAKDGTIREIYDMKPLSLRPVESKFSVRYALEMNVGAFERLGVGPGDVIRLPESF